MPGARERPGNCPVQIAREDDGTVTITIPPRGVSPIVLFFAAVLLGNLLLTLYTGLVLLLTHRSVLFMAQISPSGLPSRCATGRRRCWSALLLAEALGFFTLAAILRPVAVRDTVEIAGNGCGSGTGNGGECGNGGWRGGMCAASCSGASRRAWIRER